MRLSAARYLLLGIRGLFEGSDEVTRREFERYLQSVNLQERFPGAYAVGWNLRVPHHELPEFERKVRQDRSIDAAGYPDFRVHPLNAEAEHHLVTYLQPMEVNRAVSGYDISSSAERLAAIEQARDTGAMVATVPLELNDGHDDRAGFLLILPVYRYADPASLEQRRQNYLGALSIVFRISVLMSTTIQERFEAVSILHVNDVDESTRQRQSALKAGTFYSRGRASADATTQRQTLTVGGRAWEFTLPMSEELLPSLHSHFSRWIIAGFGFSFSLLASLWIASVASARDEARRQAELLTVDLRSDNENLRRSNTKLGQSAYVASHDLQTPVRNIEMSVTLLADALTNRMNPQIRDHLDYLRDSASRMRNLVEDLLSFAQVDRETMEMGNVDLQSVVRKVLESMALSIRENGASISVGELPVVRGDQDQLERLFRKLLSNAIKYRHHDRALQVHVQAALAGDYWNLRFVDNGLGIPSHCHDKVFEPLQRLHRQEEVVGTGLGLSICRQIASSHDGRIWIESSSDAGTTFTVSIPVRETLCQAA